MKSLCLVLLVVNGLALIAAQLQCRDETGKVVDWYVVYKFPRISSGESPLDTGFRYAFITNNTNNGWTLSEYGIDDPKKSIFGQTLEPLYSSKLSSQISYIDYNDEPPEGDTTFDGAHAKGVMASDADLGFWLIHSVPHFASEETTHAYKYPDTGGRYGQSALCISLKSSEIPKVVSQLLVIQPNVYSIKISDSLRKIATDIKNVEAKNWSNEKSGVQHLVSVGGLNFTSFGKSPDNHIDLYGDIVAKSLNTDLYVETWRRSPYLDAVCDKPTVENVDTIGFNFSNSKLKGSFEYTEDHSKWAVAKNSTHPYVCIGDINRMQSQAKRGGQTTCAKINQVWKYLDGWVTYIDACKQRHLRI